MKKLILIILLFASNISIAQYSTMFNDTLNPFGPGGSDLRDIVQDDSFYYALGGVNNYEPQWSNMIIKLDRNFQIVNKRKYIDTTWLYANYPYNTMVVNKKQIVICPQITKNPNTPFFVNGKIIAIDKNTMDTLWTRIITHPDTAYINQPNAQVFSDLTAIKGTPDGGYILTGNYNPHCIGADKRSFLLKIDSMGTIEWRRTYNNISYLYDIELTPNGGYMVMNKNWGAIVIELDSIGNIKWSKRINNDTINVEVSDMTYSGSNTFIGINKYIKNGSISYPEYGLIAFKINILTRQILWQKKYNLFHSIDCIGLHQAIGVEALPNGDIVVSGTVRKYGNDYSGFLFKLNSNGDSLWAKTYNFSTSSTAKCQLNDMLPTNDGGFLGVGYYYTYTASTAWLIKTDANGTVGWENTKEKVKSIKFSVYPNPAKSSTTLEFDKALIYPLDIKVYNTLGQMILQSKIDKGANRIKLDLSGFEAGLYYYELQSQAQTMGSGKFVVE